MSELVMKIEGMSCDHCVRRVSKALADTPGVTTVKQVKVGSATIDYDGKPESVTAIIASLDRAGYDATTQEGTAVGSETRKHVIH